MARLTMLPARWALWLAACAGCTHAQAAQARTAGEIAAITGVAGIVGGVLATAATPRGQDLVLGFSLLSAAGILTYAIGELNDPALAGAPLETPEQRHRRWAKILTQRAAGAAREGNCERVRRLEVRIRDYDPDIHDFVFLRDPEIARCLPAP
jgi:hypothetical protein